MENTNLIKIVTHNGPFHCDEAMAVAICTYASEETDYQLVRTRDPMVIKYGDIVLDVGGEYDPEVDRFDHHQPAGAGQRITGVEYATAGIVWKKYYGEVIKEYLKTTRLINPLLDYHEVRDMVDDLVLSPIDDIDNGASPEGLSFSSVVSGYNLDDPFSDLQDTAFIKAVNLCKELLTNSLRRVVGELNGRSYLLAEIDSQQGYDYLLLDRHVAWTNSGGVILRKGYKYVVYPSGGAWRVQAVSPRKSGLNAHPKEWRGLEHSALEEVTGVSGATFCHRAGFICGATSQTAAIELVHLSILNKAK